LADGAQTRAGLFDAGALTVGDIDGDDGRHFGGAVAFAHLNPEFFLEGFGEQGERFAEQISAQAGKFAFLKYGFRMSKSDIRSYDVHDSLENVAGKLKDEIAGRNEPLTALLTGVDDGWEVCLFKFMVDLINASAPGNLGDFRERGML